MREAVFDMLTSRGGVEGARVADLFAGSGALGIEALSRGAAQATFVDADRRAAMTIRANLGILGPLASRGTVVRSDVVDWLRAGGAGGSYDLVLCDPPYSFDGWDRLLRDLGPLVVPGGLVVAEAAGPVAVPPGWVSVRSRSYGASVVSLVGPAGHPSP